MTLQLNLAWWAQLALVAIVAVAAYGGKVTWGAATAGTGATPAANVTTSPLPAAAAEWVGVAPDWMAQTSHVR